MSEIARLHFDGGENEAITDTWIELAGWSRRDMIDLRKSEEFGDDDRGESDRIYADILSRRAVACSLQMADGSHFTDHKNISADVLLDLDLAVSNWLPVAVYTFIGRHRQLGEAAGLKLLRTSGVVSALATETEAESQPTTN